MARANRPRPWAAAPVVAATYPAVSPVAFVLLPHAEHTSSRRPAVAAAATQQPPARPRVLHVGNYFAPHIGGIETHLGTVAATMAGDLDLRLLVANHAGPHTVVERREPYRLARVGMPVRVAGAPLLPGLADWMQRWAGEITEIHHPHPMAFLAWLAARPPGSLVVRYHSEIVRQRVLRRVAAPWLQAVFAQAAAIVPTSPPLADAPELARWRHKVQPIPLGVVLDDFAATPAVEREVAAIRARLGGPFALLLGRHVAYKGIAVLLQAARGDESGRLRAVLIGDGPLRRRLAARVARWRLGDRVWLMPPVGHAQRQAWLRAADVLVLPSVARNEAFGLVLLEAFASGTPAISTALGTGTSWVNRHGETGLVVPPQDPAALQAALLALLGDPARRAAYAAAARERVESEFDAVRMMRPRTLALYRQLLADRRAT